MSWLKAMNPTAPINGEAEALRAARASAFSIFIGVAVGVVSTAWSFVNAGDTLAAASENVDAATTAIAAASIQVIFGLGIALVVVQLGFAIVQWRDPKKFIAILFLVMIALGLLLVLAAPMAASMAPTGAPPTPMWQIALSAVIMLIQAALHITGLRGINKLDALQMEAAR